MKKIFSVIALFGAMLFSSCSSCSHTDKETKQVETVPTIEQFNVVLNKNYNSIKDTFPEVKFYESQIVLTDIPEKEGVQLKTVCNVFQAGEYSYQFVYDQDTSYIVKVHDYWLEDVVINPENIISLDSAFTQLYKADIVKPKSPLLVLRNPLGPKIGTPGYIFGSTNTSFVKVDALNGKVTSIQ